MAIRRRLRDGLLWVVSWLHRRLSPQAFEEVREFIYLDEISVRSLLASTGEGGVPAERTLEQTQSHRTGQGAGISVGPASVHAGSEKETTERTQERRHFDLIQSKFTKLHKSDRIKKRLSLENLKSGDRNEVPLDDLRRADVLELKVEITAHLLFRFYKTMSYLSDIPHLEMEVGEEIPHEVDIIGGSLGNNIPIVAEAVDYKVVTGDDGSTIKPVDSIGDDDAEPEPLRLVSLLRTENLWVDPIQVLLSEDEFVAYVRVESVEVGTWYPLKLERAMASLSESLAEDFHSQLEDAMGNAERQLDNLESPWEGEGSGQPRLATNPYILRYSEGLEEETGVDLEEGDRVELVKRALEEAQVSKTMAPTEKRKRLLNKYTDIFVEEQGVEDVSEEERMELRSQLTDTTSTGEGSGVGAEESDRETGDQAPTLEVKTVGLYW